MPAGPPLLLLASLWALRVTTDSADALCPPLEATRKAVHSRVGEVAGKDYEARYTVVRNAAEGNAVIRLVVTDENGNRALSRNIPLDQTSCADAAQAIALILETHFGGVGDPTAPPEPASSAKEPAKQKDPAQPRASASLSPGEQSTEEHPVLDSPRAPPRPSGKAAAPPTRQRWELGLHGGTDDRAIPRLGAGLRFAPLEQLVLGADALFPLRSRWTRDAGLDFRLTTISLFGGALFSIPAQDWRFRLGPASSFQLQFAELLANDGKVETTGTQFRAVVGLGGQAQIVWQATRDLAVQASFWGTGRLTSAAVEYRLDDTSGEIVLAPRGFQFTGSFGAFWTF